LRNVSKAFEIKQPKLFFKKQVLLVDDVLTTGTTASECAKALKLVGASKVFLSAIARAKL
jgi:predicted amidophosphoribosyltransferase